MKKDKVSFKQTKDGRSPKKAATRKTNFEIRRIFLFTFKLVTTMIATSLDAMNAYKNKIRDCGSNTFMFLYMQDSNFFFFYQIYAG